MEMELGWHATCQYRYQSSDFCSEGPEGPVPCQYLSTIIEHLTMMMITSMMMMKTRTTRTTRSAKKKLTLARNGWSKNLIKKAKRKQAGGWQAGGWLAGRTMECQFMTATTRTPRGYLPINNIHTSIYISWQHPCQYIGQDQNRTRTKCKKRKLMEN